MKSTSSFVSDEKRQYRAVLDNPQFAIIVVFIVMLLVSWRRWTSAIADSGREMDLPLRLLNGELLYRDVYYLYLPLSPYLNSLLYRLFGVHLDVLLTSGIICSALIVALSYRIARRILSPSEATLATLVIIVLCVFKPTGNLISPYAFAALHGTVLSLGILLLMLRYAVPGVQNGVNAKNSSFDSRADSTNGSESEVRSRAPLFWSGILLGLAAITKVEFVLTGAVTIIATLVYLHRKRYGRLLTDLSFAALPSAVIALPVYALFFYLVDWRTLVEDCHIFYTHLPASLIYYNSLRTGLDRPLFSFLQMVGASAVGVAAMSIIVLSSDRERRMLHQAGVVLALSLLVVVMIRLVVGIQWDGSPLRAMPLLLLTFILYEWRRGSFEAKKTTEWTCLFIISIYSLVVLARVLGRVPSGGAFGSFFLPTSMILFCYLFLRFLPQALVRWTSDQFAAKRAQRLSKILFTVVAIATVPIYAVRYRKTFSYEVTAERGHLFEPGLPGRAIDDALNFMRTETKPSEAVAVLPEGSDLTFLTGRRMPLRHQMLIPGLMSEKDEQEAMTTLQRERVRYVLIINRPMLEFGLEAFGRDFYTILGRWLDDHYRIVKVFGESSDPNQQIGDPKFFIKVLEYQGRWPQ